VDQQNHGESEQKCRRHQPDGLVPDKLRRLSAYSRLRLVNINVKTSKILRVRGGSRPCSSIVYQKRRSAMKASNKPKWRGTMRRRWILRCCYKPAPTRVARIATLELASV
jgi:hypothetical protein